MSDHFDKLRGLEVAVNPCMDPGTYIILKGRVLCAPDVYKALKDYRKVKPSESVYFDDPAFIESIRQNPDDDTVRLAYADWLEEHEQGERAEFIRAQIEDWSIARLAKDGNPVGLRNPRAKKLFTRWLELEKQFGSAWFTFPELGTPVFSRGFVEVVVCPSADWIKLGDATLRKHPIRRVVWTDRPWLNWDVLWIYGPMNELAHFQDDDKRVTMPYIGGDSQLQLARLRWPGVEFEIREAVSH